MKFVFSLLLFAAGMLAIAMVLSSLNTGWHWWVPFGVFGGSTLLWLSGKVPE